MTPPAAPTPPRGLLRGLLAYARPYVLPLAAALLLMLLMTAATNFLPILLQRAIDGLLIPPEAVPAPVAERWRALLRLGAGYLALAVLALACRYAQELITAGVGQGILRRVRADVYAKALRLPLAFFDRMPLGKLMTRVTSDVEAVQRFVTDGVVGSIADLFMIFGVLGFMFYLSWPLATGLLLTLPLLIWLLVRIQRHLRGANRLIRERQAELNGHLQEYVAGMTTVQLFNREPAARTLFDRHNRALRSAQFEEVRWFSLFFPLLEVAQAGAMVVILALGGYGLQAGWPSLSLGVIIAFLSYVRSFFWPLSALSDKGGALQQALAAAERLFGLLQTPETISDPAAPVQTAPPRGELVFDQVWFAYQPEEWILRDISFTVPSGHSLAIVGATGAGKTTVISLLSRFYDVQRGRVLVGGCDVRELPQAALRRAMGVVLQEPFLFAGPVIDNLTLSRPTVSRADAIAAACFVQADTFIRRLPQGYDTPLGERGGVLSTGQKQLLALARALAQNPEMLLVLDEATANVDSETEHLIHAALERLVRGRTSVIIAHRLSTIRHADRILVLRQGRQLALGTHPELLATCAYYRRLCEMLALNPA